jgi:GT2 family glycosyltransferase
MDEVEDVLEHFANCDSRIRVFRQKINIGMMPNHTFVARQATGGFFLWLHNDDEIPPNYIERCMERFEDSPDIVLVGPRADAYMENRYWFTYRNFSSLGQSVYDRLRNLIDIGYSQPSAFQQYFFGVFRRDTLAECTWEDGKYYWDESFSLFFRLSEKGFLHFADDVTLDKFNFKEDFKKWRDKRYCDKPMRYKFAGARVSELMPKTLNIISVVAKSRRLSVFEKFYLLNFCCLRFMGALVASKVPLWKRIARLPFRLVRKVLHVNRRILGKHR